MDELNLSEYKQSLMPMAGYELLAEEKRLKSYYKSRGLGDRQVWQEAEAYAQAFIDVQNSKGEKVAKKYGKRFIPRSTRGFYR